MNDLEKITCDRCEYLKSHMDSPDVMESKLAESCYLAHLKNDHGLSSLEVLKKTGVWVEIA